MNGGAYREDHSLNKLDSEIGRTQVWPTQIHNSKTAFITTNNSTGYHGNLILSRLVMSVIGTYGLLTVPYEYNPIIKIRLLRQV